jgi:hypothetical protein
VNAPAFVERSFLHCKSLSLLFKALPG